MIRIAIATAVVGGAIAASACFFTCGTQSAVAGTSQEVADGADPGCDKADCPPEHCDRAKANKVAAHTGHAADAAPADGEDHPCKYSQKAHATTLAATSTTKVIHVENATCGSCIVPIREQLTQLAGIASIEGGEDFKDVIVTLKADSKVSDDQLIAAVKKAGYTATIKANEAPKQS